MRRLLTAWSGEGKKKLRYGLMVGLFLAPAMVFYLAFTVFPVIKTLIYSLYKVEIIGIVNTFEYVGLANFRAVAVDEVFWRAARNTLTWAFASPILEIPLGLLLAIYLARGTRLSKVARVLWFTPVLLPQIVVGIIWAWIYNYDWGIINGLLRLIGLGNLAQAWLGQPSTALPALIVTTTWVWTGFNMIILLAAVASIPKELFEAATIDGCKAWQVLAKVIIPLIRPVLANLMILCFIGKMKVFDLIWATTKGGPLWATETVATYTVKRAFYWDSFEKGFPSAMASTWFVIIMTIAVTATILMRRKEVIEY